MPWGAAIAAVGSLAGSALGAYGSISAANTQAKSANHATDVQMDIYNQQQGREAPYLQAGNNALAQLQSGFGLGPGGNGIGSLNAPFSMADFHNSPGYNFQLQQGQNSILNNRSALGGVNSGNTLKSLTQFGQGVANQDYWNSYNAYTQQQNQRFGQYQTLAGSGQNAAADLGALGAQTGASMGNNIIGAGNAQAAGTVGAANAINNGINGIANNYLLYNALSNGGGQTGGNPFSGNGFSNGFGNGSPIGF